MIKPSTLNMMTLSTGHLSQATRGALVQDPKIFAGFGMSIRDDGFLLPVDAEMVSDVGHDLPGDLLHAAKFAFANGADFILFDAEATPTDLLPWYGTWNDPMGIMGWTGWGVPAFEKRQLTPGGPIATLPDSRTAAIEDLRYPAAERPLKDENHILSEEGAWITAAEASIRIHVSDEDVCVSIHALGIEDEAVVDSLRVARDDLSAMISESETAQSPGTEAAAP